VIVAIIMVTGKVDVGRPSRYRMKPVLTHQIANANRTGQINDDM
jgi:hypothetical protein